MKQRFVCRGLFIPLLLLVVLLSSCVREHIIGGERNEQEPTVTFSLKVPKVATPNPTRSLTTEEESGVSTIHVMVFEKDGGYKYTRVGTQSGQPIQKGENIQITFGVTLPKGQFDLVFIANGLNAITQAGNALVEGASKDAVLGSLIESRAKGTKWTEADIPMWGYRYGVVIDENTSLTGVNGIAMVRMLAKIEVVLSKEAAGLGGNNENFSIEELVLYNYNTKGTLVSNMADSHWNATENIAIKPNVPTGVGVKVPTAEFLEYSKALDDPTGTFFTPSEVRNTIYTFESKNGTVNSSLENVCLVIGGTYKGGANKSYYRVDFVDRKNNNQLLDLLRNHRYNFVISAITGDGLPTHKEAYEAGPVNIEANVLQWNAGDMGDVVFNDQNFLAINPVEIEHDRNAVTGQEIILKTDYNGGKPELSISSSETAPGIALPDDWLTLSPTVTEEPIVVGGYPATKYTISYDATKNETGNIRKAYIYVKVGRLTNVIRVTQTEKEDVRVRIIDFTTKVELTELLFASSVGVDPTPQSFIVDWAPILADLTVNITPISTYAFPTDKITPSLGNVPGGTGTIPYNISPKTLTAAEITANPFMEKISKVDFMTTNGISYESKSIFLRQINYNLLTDIAPNYILESQTETINVKANFPWTITGVSDTYDILQSENSLIGKTGGDNTTPGDPLSFTMSTTSDDSKHDKTATITITNLIDNTPWTITITAIGHLYLGYFGGELKATGGVWQFERKLYVQANDESTSTAWGPETLVPGGSASSVWDGKGTTLNLRAITYPAANLCFTKNANHASINGVSDADYVWYLPAQNQLMAAWGAQTSFGSAAFASGSYWSVTEGNALNSWYASFTNGGTRNHPKNVSNRVRCVREL